MIPRGSKHYWILLGLCSFWILLLILPPLLAQLQWGLETVPSVFFSKVCHQRPERSFHWLGQQLPVCHRCLGIYVGFWAGLIALPLARRLSALLLSRPRLLLLFFLPMFVNVLLQNQPYSRFLTGALAGFPVALFAWMAAEQLPGSFNLFFRRSHEPSPR